MNSLKLIRLLLALTLVSVSSTLSAQSISKKSNFDSSVSGIQFFSNRLTLDTLELKQKENFSSTLKKLNCISGTLFFSGTGFANTVAIQYNGSSEAIQSYFDKCVAGSKVTFEKCVFKTASGATLNVHKTFLLR
jgi:hypothetical protein